MPIDFLLRGAKLAEGYSIALNGTERNGLMEMTRNGLFVAQKVVSALILLNCDQGEFNVKRNNSETIAELPQIS